MGTICHLCSYGKKALQMIKLYVTEIKIYCIKEDIIEDLAIFDLTAAQTQ